MPAILTGLDSNSTRQHIEKLATLPDPAQPSLAQVDSSRAKTGVTL